MPVPIQRAHWWSGTRRFGGRRPSLGRQVADAGQGLAAEQTSLDTCHGGQVLWNGVLFGSHYQRAKSWAALDARTGEVRSRTRELAMGSVLAADGRFYCLSQDGEMALLKAASPDLEIVGRFRLVAAGKNDVWTHPVILDGRLFLRYHERMSCYDVRGSGGKG